MIAWIIVAGTVALALAFGVAWLLSRELRNRVESPKHEFGEAVRRYDRAQAGRGRPAGNPRGPHTRSSS